jgi:hypothetical protein
MEDADGRSCAVCCACVAYGDAMDLADSARRSLEYGLASRASVEIARERLQRVAAMVAAADRLLRDVEAADDAAGTWPSTRRAA